MAGKDLDYRGAKSSTETYNHEYRLVVYVNGTQYPVETVSFSGDSVGGLPGGITQVGSGKKSRTGTIEWGNLQVTPSYVTNRPTNAPYRNTPAGVLSSNYTGEYPGLGRIDATRENYFPVPKKGDKVVIRIKDETRSDYWVTRFTGYIKSTSGSLAEGTVSSAITDGLDEILNRKVSLEPYCLGYNGAYGMTPLTQVCKALETVGLGILPAQDDKTLIQTSQQYGFAPIQGKLSRYGNNQNTFYTNTGISTTEGLRFYLKEYAAFHRDKVFIHLSRFDYVSQTSESVSGINSQFHECRVQYYPGIQRLRVCILDWSKSSTNPQVTEIYNEEYKPPREHFGQYIPTAVAWTPTTCWIFTGELDEAGVPKIVERQIVNTPLDWNKQIQFAYNYGSFETSMRVVNRAEALDQLKAYVVKFPKEPYQVQVALKPGDGLEGSQYLNKAVRSYDTTPAAKVLEDWANACLGSYWIDNNGILQLADFKHFQNRHISRTVDVSSTTFAGAWATNTGNVYTRVSIKGKKAQPYGTDSLPMVTVWKPEAGNLIELPKNAVKRDFIEVPAEQDWVGVDYDLKMVRNPNTTDVAYPKGIVNPYPYGGLNAELASGDAGTIFDIGVITDESLKNFRKETIGNLKFAAGLPWNDLSGKLTKLGWRTVMTEFSAYVKQGTHDKNFYLNNPDEPLGNTGYHYLHYNKYYRQGFPLIRAKFRTDWTEYSHNGKDYTPKSNTKENLPSVYNWGLSPLIEANTYEHNFDWWVSEELAKEYLKDLESMVIKEIHEFDDLEVAPELYREVGNIEHWVWQDDAGVSWEGDVLIQSINETWANGYPSQTVSVMLRDYKPTAINSGGRYQSPNEGA